MSERWHRVFASAMLRLGVGSVGFVCLGDLVLDLCVECGLGTDVLCCIGSQLVFTCCIEYERKGNYVASFHIYV
jgi:hypothetical protein